MSRCRTRVFSVMYTSLVAKGQGAIDCHAKLFLPKLLRQLLTHVQCRQGRQFVGLAQSLGPHLGYIIAPALEALVTDIRSVERVNKDLQQSRRRSASCSLPPVEALTVHDSADSISSANQVPAGQQQPRQGHPPLRQQSSRPRTVPRPPSQQQQQSATTRMMSPFQTWTAPAVAQSTSPDCLPEDAQRDTSPDRPGSDRLDLSPAKTALDMSMLDIARMQAASPGSGGPSVQPESVTSPQSLRRGSGEQGSERKSATAAEVNAAAVAVMCSSIELERESQPSIEASPKGSGGSQDLAFGSSKGRARRRVPVPMLRASSPLSAYGSEPSGNLPRQLSIPGLSLAGYTSSSQSLHAQDESAQSGALPSSPFAAAAQAASMQTPFAGGLPMSSSPLSSAWFSSPSMQTSGSTISVSSLLPPLSAFSQAPGSSQRHPCLSPLAAASLAASLPPEMSTSAMAVLSAPMSAMPPTFYSQSQSMAALTMPSIVSMSTSAVPRSPNQQSRSMLPPAPFSEPQPRTDQQHSYRLPAQLQSTSLLLQLLPAGSAQSLNQLMSRSASGAPAEYNPQEDMQISRSISLTTDSSTSVSVGSPRRSLMNMSRAVSEQLHLASDGKGVQRHFLADLQQRWTAGHQVTSSMFLLMRQGRFC